MQVTASMVKELRERTGAGMMECKKALVDSAGDIDAAIENMRKSGQAKADKKASRIAAEGLIAIQLSEDARRAAMVEVNCETDFVAKEDEFKTFVALVTQKALDSEAADAEALGGVPLESNGGGTIDERRRELVAKIGENITVRRVAVISCRGDRLGSYLHGNQRIGSLVDVKGGNEEVGKDLAMHIAWSNPQALNEDNLDPGFVEREREIIKAQVADSGKPPEIQEKMILGRVNKLLKEITLLGQSFVKDDKLSVAKHLQANGAEVLAYARFEVGEGIEKKSENFAEEVMAQVHAS
jgi:elongation factor Ts